MNSLRFALAALAGVALATSAAAHGYKKSGLEIVHPWIMETSGPDGTVSMTIKNAGKAPDRLLRVTVGLAQSAKLQKPDPAAALADIEAIEIPAGGEAVLCAAGPHVRLTGLKKKLGAYDTLPLVLVFERAGRFPIEVMVEEKN